MDFSRFHDVIRGSLVDVLPRDVDVELEIGEGSIEVFASWRRGEKTGRATITRERTEYHGGDTVFNPPARTLLGHLTTLLRANSVDEVGSVDGRPVYAAEVEEGVGFGLFSDSGALVVLPRRRLDLFEVVYGNYISFIATDDVEPRLSLGGLLFASRESGIGIEIPIYHLVIPHLRISSRVMSGASYPWHRIGTVFGLFRYDDATGRGKKVGLLRATEFGDRSGVWASVWTTDAGTRIAVGGAGGLWTISAWETPRGIDVIAPPVDDALGVAAPLWDDLLEELDPKRAAVVMTGHETTSIGYPDGGSVTTISHHGDNLETMSLIVDLDDVVPSGSERRTAFCSLTRAALALPPHAVCAIGSLEESGEMMWASRFWDIYVAGIAIPDAQTTSAAISSDLDELIVELASVGSNLISTISGRSGDDFADLSGAVSTAMRAVE